MKGEERWLVQSKKNPQDYYHTTLTNCNCKGFEYRKHCRHLEEVFKKVEEDINKPKKARLVYES